MSETRSRFAEVADRDRRLAKWGEWEFIYCAIVLAPGLPVTALLFWYIQRGSDMARMFAAAKAMMLLVFALLVLYLSEAEIWLAISVVMVAWGAAAYLLIVSPRLQAYQAVNREKYQPTRRKRRARAVHSAPRRSARRSSNKRQ